MPDRFDLSTLTDLEVSLDLAGRWCVTADPARVSPRHHQHLQLARAWLSRQHLVVRQWLNGTLRVLGESSETFPTDVERVRVEVAVRALGEVIGQVRNDTLRLAERADAVHSLPAGGNVMALDFARHVVRVACCATIDRGWPWPE
ncbi:hypothetical protein [Kineococcus sp. SYSU DK018]|uniref:hypothetical protein n=1 Tax=Kineococcus sp. SYSU DK018 TaxID=3383139 RepID=UPI003D7E8D3D